MLDNEQKIVNLINYIHNYQVISLEYLYHLVWYSQIVYIQFEKRVKNLKKWVIHVLFLNDQQIQNKYLAT